MRKVYDIVSELRKHKDNGNKEEFYKTIDSMDLEETENMKDFCEVMLEACESNIKIIKEMEKINGSIRKEF